MTTCGDQYLHKKKPVQPREFALMFISITYFLSLPSNQVILSARTKIYLQILLHAVVRFPVDDVLAPPVSPLSCEPGQWVVVGTSSSILLSFYLSQELEHIPLFHFRSSPFLFSNFRFQQTRPV